MDGRNAKETALGEERVEVERPLTLLCFCELNRLCFDDLMTRVDIFYLQFASSCRLEMHCAIVSSDADWNSGLQDCGLGNHGNHGEIHSQDLKISRDGVQCGASAAVSLVCDVGRTVEDLR
jgi:hypothetical protein